jgi:diguanylate cyclase (GGDEF)-like protein/PAS domain S-box-containing protein
MGVRQNLPDARLPMMHFYVFAVLGMLAAVAYLACAGYALGAHSKSPANQLFALICATQAYWAVTAALYTSAPTRTDACLWYHASVPSWLMLPALVLYFFLVLTASDRPDSWARSKRIRAGFLLLPLVVFGRPVWEGGLTVSDHRLTTFGWSEVPSGDAWDLLFTVYYLVYAGMGLFLLGRWARRNPDPNARRQARYILATGIASLTIITLFERLLPQIGLLRLPPIAPTALVIWVGGIWYAMVRHRLMTLSAEVAARDILRTMADGLLLVDRNEVIRVANRAACELLESPGGEPGLIGKQIAELFPTGRAFGNDHWTAPASDSVLRYELAFRSPRGREVPLAVATSLVHDRQGYSPGVVAILRDISLEKAAEQHLIHLANHDPLTGLPNRVLLHDRVTQALARARRYQKPFAVLLLDLDHFKEINDTLGHAVGDSLLEVVAVRLRSLVRECDTVARLGGDEFVLVANDLARPEDGAVVARRCIDHLSAPFFISGQSLRISCSIGISVHPADGDSLDRLLKHADLALYRSKQDGRGTYTFFEATFATPAEPPLRPEAAPSKAT